MKKMTIFLALLWPAVCFFSCQKNDDISSPVTFYGKPVNLGNGTVRSYVTLNKERIPTSLGFSFTESMLQGLPADVDQKMIMLDLPAEAATTGFEHMELDWNPKGHVPLPIYGFPHFDFHFYLVGMDELMNVAGGPDMAPVDPQFIPTDYSSGIMAVPHMGVHWTDSLSSEFHGTMFTHTFVYGFYKSKLLFVEPMITKAFLDSKTDITLPIKQPAAFQKAGYYPTKYQVQYDAKKHEYHVSIENLTEHG